jgi:hypothetical protein
MGPWWQRSKEPTVTTATANQRPATQAGAITIRTAVAEDDQAL